MRSQVLKTLRYETTSIVNTSRQKIRIFDKSRSLLDSNCYFSMERLIVLTKMLECHFAAAAADSTKKGTCVVVFSLSEISCLNHAKWNL